jgi:subfamily B ATP-binding cassette protein MsbA
MLFTAAVGLVFPLGVRRLIDSALVEADAEQLNVVAVALLVMFFLESIANFTQSYIVSATGERLGTDLGLKVTDHLLRLSMRFYDTRRSGDILAIVNSDVTLVRSGTLGTALPLLSQVVRLFGSIAIAMSLNWRLALIVIVIALYENLLASRFGRALNTLR